MSISEEVEKRMENLHCFPDDTICFVPVFDHFGRVIIINTNIVILKSFRIEIVNFTAHVKDLFHPKTRTTSLVMVDNQS